MSDTPPAAHRWRAVVAYDGTNYHGFQRQAGDTPTIQLALEQALRSVTGQHINITGAGRTDAGVHASHQVISWEQAWRHGPDALLRAVNTHLPGDIASMRRREGVPRTSRVTPTPAFTRGNGSE